MGKSKWILICGVLLLAFGVNISAAGRSDSQVFLQEDATPQYSATLAAFAAELPATGEKTAVSVSNTMATPEVPGLDLSGFPTGLNTEGAVWVFCYNRIDGSTWTFNSDSDPSVGAGLDAAGMLPAGGTWTAYVSDILGAAGFDAATEDFIGYCYFVGNFDAIAGTYVNTFTSVSSQQAFPMQSDFTGVPIVGTEVAQ
ncbi:MAG: hypothetical protein P8020_08150 [Acidobacteriota bacterium]